MLYGTVQGILLVLVRGMNNICKKVKLPIVLVPGLKRNIFSSASATQKGIETVIAKNGSYLDLGQCCV